MSEKGYFDEESLEPWIIPVLSKKDDMLRPTRHGAARDKYEEGKTYRYIVNRLVWMHSGMNLETVYLIQELLFKGRVQIRFCYYTWNKRGDWGWGQFAPMLPKEELVELLDYAKEKGLIT